MKSVFTLLLLSTVIGTTSISQAQSNYYQDRAAFVAAVGSSFTDDYSGYEGAPRINSVITNAAMSAVKGQATYTTLSFPDQNQVGDVSIRGGTTEYCSGCNGNFKLSFGGTTYSKNGGVFGVGLDVLIHTSRYVAIGGDDPAKPTYPGGVLVEFTDGTNELIWIPADVGYYDANTYFFGITDERGIASITIGTEMSRPHFWVIDNLTIADRPALSRLTLEKSVVAGCLSLTATVTLPEPAPNGGVSVAISETLASVTTPTTLKIRKGATSGSFAIATAPVAVTEHGAVSATLGATILNQPLAVRPIGVGSVGLKPSKVAGGRTVSGSASLECKAAPGPIIVELSTSDTGVANPSVSSVLIPAGSQIGNFQVTTTPVATKTTVRIGATANDVTASKELTVSP